MKPVTRKEEVIVKQILLASIIANVKRIVGRISILTLSPWKVCFYFNPCSSSLTLHSVCIISNNSSLVPRSLFHDPFPNLNPNPHPLLPSLDCLLLSPERGGERCRTGAEYCCSGYKARRCIQVWFLYIVLQIKRKCMESSEDNLGFTYEAWRIIIQESEMGLSWMILALLLCIHTSYRFYFFFSQLCICVKERCKINPDWN